jgi:hypothetical protein
MTYTHVGRKPNGAFPMPTKAKRPDCFSEALHICEEAARKQKGDIRIATSKLGFWEVTFRFAEHTSVDRAMGNAGPHHPGHSDDYPRGALTTRTDRASGVLTMEGKHTLMSGTAAHLLWTDPKTGKIIGSILVNVGAVCGQAAPITASANGAIKEPELPAVKTVCHLAMLQPPQVSANALRLFLERAFAGNPMLTASGKELADGCVRDVRLSEALAAIAVVGYNGLQLLSRI